MDLRTKYDQAIQVAKRLRMEGSAEQRSDKLYFNGTVKSEDEKNQIWTALKSVPDYTGEIVADIRVVAPVERPAAAAAGDVSHPADKRIIPGTHGSGPGIDD